MLIIHGNVNALDTVDSIKYIIKEICPCFFSM